MTERKADDDDGVPSSERREDRLRALLIRKAADLGAGLATLSERQRQYAITGAALALAERLTAEDAVNFALVTATRLRPHTHRTTALERAARTAMRELAGIATESEALEAEALAHVARGVPVKRESIDATATQIRELAAVIRALMKAGRNRRDPALFRAKLLAEWLAEWPHARRGKRIEVPQLAHAFAARAETGRVARVAVALGVLKADALKAGAASPAHAQVRQALLKRH